MKIGIFHATLPGAQRKLGGVEVFVHRLASALATRGFEVEVISLNAAPYGHTYKSRHIFKEFKFLCNNKFSRLFIMPWLLNFVDMMSYDIIHTHGDDWFYFVRPAASIRTLYGSALWEARSSTSIKRRCVQFVIYLMEKLSCHLADLSVAVGREAANLYKVDGISDLFVSNTQFYPRKKTPFPSLIFIGSWLGRKRGRFVVDCFLNDILPKHAEAKLFMACDFVPDEQGIIDLASPSEEKLSAALAECWVLVSASTYEGFGIPYLEAMISGTAVVTTRNSGANYVLDNGRCGLIVEDRNFGEAILHLLENNQIRNHYERVGIDRASDFSEDKVIAQHLSYYEKAIRRHDETRNHK